MTISESVRKLWQNKEYREMQINSHKEFYKKASPEQKLKIISNLVNNSGEKHFAWKGDIVGYVALHDYIRARLGKPNFCSKDKNHTGTFVWANISGEYKRDLNDWWSLCQSCNLKDGVKKHSRFRRGN